MKGSPDFLYKQYFKESTPLLFCLRPLLEALQWNGVPRDIIQSFPHFAARFELTHFLQSMNSLGFQYKKIEIQLDVLNEQFLPCLFITKKQTPHVLLRRDHTKYITYNGKKQAEDRLPAQIKGTIFIFHRLTKYEYELQKRKPKSWLSQFFKKFRLQLTQLLVISFLSGVLSLAIPLYILAVYDRVIRALSNTMLFSFAGGVLIALVGIGLLEKLRTHLLTYIGNQLDASTGQEILEKVLSLPMTYLEQSPVGSQIARVKDYDSLRNVITGGLLNILFDLPVAILFIIVIAILGGTLALVPTFSAGAFLIFILLFYKPINNSIKQRAFINSEKNHFLLETMEKMRVLKYSNAAAVWKNRYKNLLSESCFVSYRLSMLRDSISAISEWVVLTAGFLIVGFGAVKFFQGTLPLGALIAVMILTWRILTPFRAAFVSIARIGQIQFSIRQLTALIRMPHEVPPYHRELAIGKIRGDIRFSNVTFRYSPQAKPAVFNLTFKLPAGSMTAVTGPSGSGKTTLLKLIFGLYAPQAGMIQIDGKDVSQANLLELRRQMSYVAEEDEIFYGTIEQNLQLGNPLATDDDIKKILDLLNLTDEINAMPKGLKTLIRDKDINLISPSIQNRLSIARALLIDAPILLLDQPGAALDRRNDVILMQVLKKYHRKKTIVLVTARPSHMKLADRIMVLEQGKLSMAGKPSEIVPKIMAEIQ